MPRSWLQSRTSATPPASAPPIFSSVTVGGGATSPARRRFESRRQSVKPKIATSTSMRIQPASGLMLALAMLLIVLSWIGIVPPLPRIFRSTPSQKRRPASVTTNEGRPIRVMIVPWRIPIPAQARSAAVIAAPPRPAVSRAREVGHDHAAEAGDEPDREVDLPEQQDEDLAHREQAEDGGLDEQVDEVARGQEFRVEGLEEDRDQEQSRDDRQDPALAGLDPARARI